MLAALGVLLFSQSLGASPHGISSALVGSQNRQTTREIVLFRGSPIGTQLPAYDVEDTTLDAKHPNSAEGGFYTLSGGPAKTILIRFGDLSRAIPSSAEIISATLVLTESGQSPPEFQSAGQMLKSWGEGPALTLNERLKLGGDPNATGSSIFGSATWESPHEGQNSKWDVAGASGVGDATPIPSARATLKNGELSIGGLAPAVASMAGNRAYLGTNNGFELLFTNPVDFDSSEALHGKPKLIVRYQILPPNLLKPNLAIALQKTSSSWEALVNFPAPAAPGTIAQWFFNGKKISSQPVSPAGDLAQTFKLTHAVVGPLDDPRRSLLTFKLVNSGSGAILGEQYAYTSGYKVPFSIVGLPTETGIKTQILSELESFINHFNRLCLSRSRYSFAPSGCLERVQVGNVSTGGTHEQDSITISAQELSSPNLTFADRSLLKEVALRIGAENLARTEFPAGDTSVTVKGYDGAGLSWYPGLTGGGDIRFEGALPNSLNLPEQATYSSIAANSPIAPLGPLSMTNVGLINSLVGLKNASRIKKRNSILRQFPSTVLVRAYYSNDTEVRHAILTFYPFLDGKVSDSLSFALNTGDSNSILLPEGNSKAPNPMHSASPSDLGALLVKCTANGSSGFAWIKSWQLHDAVFRGDTGVAFIDLHFIMPEHAVNSKVDYAEGTQVTDQKNDSTSLLANLTSDANKPTQFTNGKNHPNWIQIDLNRDRPLDEVQLTIDPKHFWKKFAIVAYETGQDPSQAVFWSRTEDLQWTAFSQGWNGIDPTAKVQLFGPSLVARFIRIIPLTSGNATFYKISVFSPIPAKTLTP